MKSLSFIMRLSVSGFLYLVLTLSACTPKAHPDYNPYLQEGNLYVPHTKASTIDAYQELAILPPVIALNSRNPATGRASRRTEIAREQRNEWMQFNYDLFNRHAHELKVKVQKPDITIRRLTQAGVSPDSLPFISRQRLMNILQVDVLFMHDIDINIYSSTGQDIAEATGLLLVLGAGGRSGVVPHGDIQKSKEYTVEFYKLYGKGINTPIWVYYNTSNYKGKKPQEMPKKTSLDFYRMPHFPLMKTTDDAVFGPN